jgi:hypothetical protein
MQNAFRHIAVGVSLAVSSLTIPASGQTPLDERLASNVDFTKLQATAQPSIAALVATKEARGSVNEKMTPVDSEQTTQAVSSDTVTIAVGNGPTGIGFGEKFAWVTNGLDDSVSKISPHNSRVTTTIPLNTGGFPVRVATTPGAVWISNCGIDAVVPETVMWRQSSLSGSVHLALASSTEICSSPTRTIGSSESIHPRIKSLLRSPFVSNRHRMTSISSTSRSPSTPFGCPREFPLFYVSTRRRIALQRRSPSDHAVDTLANWSPVPARSGSQETSSRIPSFGSTPGQTR